jgi:virginiamycin B lyase
MPAHVKRLAPLVALAQLTGCELVEPLRNPPPVPPQCQDHVVEDGTFIEITIPTPNSVAWGIAAVPDGNVWFVEAGVNKIGRLSSTELAVSEWKVEEFPRTVSGNPTFIVAGPDGNAWYADPTGGHVGRISPAGEMHELAIPGASPYTLVVGPDSNIWFSDHLGFKIGRITLGAGADMTSLITEFPTFPEEEPTLMALAAGSDGNVWFTDIKGNTVGFLTARPPHTLSRFAIPTPNSAVLGIAPGADGNLWFAEEGRIGRVTPDGMITEFVLPPGSRPNVVAPGRNGDIWYVDPWRDRIGQITTCGTHTEFVVPGTTPSRPHVLDVDAAGDVWFTQDGSNEIGRFHPTRFHGK